MNRRILAAAVAGVVLAGFGRHALASPYASAITESGGTVSFTLNDAADEVIVIRDGVATSLGALGKGPQTFARNGAANYKIVVNKAASAGYLNATAANTGVVNQISDDGPLLQLERISGLTVNKNPATPALFGRVYAAAPRTSFTVSGRFIDEGIFIYSPDLGDPFLQQDAANGIGFKAGLDGDFATGGNSSPYRLELDRDGNVYIGDWADATGTVYRTSPDVGSSGGTHLLIGQGSAVVIAPSNTLNHGSVAGMFLTGGVSTNDLQLWTIDEDMSPDGQPTQLNSVWHYNLGNATQNFSGIPDQVAHNVLLSDVATGGVICDITRGKDGKFYLAQNRADGSQLGLAVVSPTGQTLYDSLSDSIARGIDGNSGVAGIQDLFRSTRGIDISADGQYLALATNNAGATWIVPLLDGIPDMPNSLKIDAFGTLPPITGLGRTTSHEAAFDAAGNLYVGNWSAELIREFVSGGVSQTVYDSAGNFTTRIGPNWNVAGGGNFSNTANWMLGVVPNAKSAMVTFGNVNTGPATVTVDAPVTLGNVRFDSLNSYTIAGTNTITLDSFGEPRVTVLAGNHSITAPVVATQNTQFTVAAGSNLTVSNFTLNNPAANIVTAGGGVTALNNYRANSLSVNNGTAKVIANGTDTGTSKVATLTIAGATDAWTAKLDLTNNKFIVDNGNIVTIQNQIKNAYAGGAWTGNGITSSTAAADASSAHKTAIGYANAGSLGIGSFGGQNVGSLSTVFRYTLSGDANLSGNVDLTDFTFLAANFNKSSGAVWLEGDFNYDSKVDLTDFTFLASNFNQSVPAASLGSVVPEPASLAALALSAGCLLGGRRRRH